MQVAPAGPIRIRRLFAERNPRLVRRLVPGALSLLELITHERRINSFVSSGAELSPSGFCDRILESLDIAVVTEGESNLTAAVRPVVCANHPTGGVEGLALVSILTRVRGSCLVPANDLLSLIRPLAPVLVPIRRDLPSRVTAEGFARAFAGDDPILVFPAGVTARVRAGAQREFPWRSTFVTRARLSGREIVPVAVSGRNSRRFNSIFKVRRALGIGLNLEMMLLVDELLRHRGRTFTFRFLPPRRMPAPDAASTGRDGDHRATCRLQHDVERVARSYS